MTSTTFFIIFIPILAILLLAINLILAPHNPYQEKDSVFECGFHSFLGQNRTQFSVSFFIFGLLFLLFDLEILLVYPYSVSSYTNDIYGLVVMMVFFVLLTLGFIFELGKNALTIDSRQTISNNQNVSNSHFYMSSILLGSPEAKAKMEEKVTDYEYEAEHVPHADELHEMYGDDHEKIKAHSDDLLKKFEEDKEKLLEEIKEENEKENILDPSAEDFTNRVDAASKLAETNVKETNNVAVESIDDSSDADESVFHYLPFIIVSELPLIRVLSVVYTLYSLNVFSKIYNHIRYYLCK